MRDISRKAVQSAVSTTSTNQGNARGDYQDGIYTAIQMMRDQESDPNHKPFSNMTKGKLMGLCGVTKWCKIPSIWKEIEACKTDKDFRTILKRH